MLNNIIIINNKHEGLTYAQTVGGCVVSVAKGFRGLNLTRREIPELELEYSFLP